MRKQYQLVKFTCDFCQCEKTEPEYFVGTKRVCQNCRHYEFYLKGIDFCDVCRQPIDNLIGASQIIENEYFGNNGADYRRTTLQMVCKSCREKETGLLS